MKKILFVFILLLFCLKAFVMDAFQSSKNILVLINHKSSTVMFFKKSFLSINEVKVGEYNFNYITSTGDTSNEIGIKEKFQLKFNAIFVISDRYLMILLPGNMLLNINYPKIKCGDIFYCILQSEKKEPYFPIYYGQFENGVKEGNWVENDNNNNRFILKYKNGIIKDTIDVWYRNPFEKIRDFPIWGRYIAFILEQNLYLKGTFKDYRDGKIYKTSRIGNKTWLAENLNFKTKQGSWCYDNSDSNCITYGRLYNWKTANKACPVGWHLSSHKDWEKLFYYFPEGKREVNRIIANSELWSEDNMKNANNLTGFSATPGGRIDERGKFKSKGYGCFFWTTELDTSQTDYWVKDSILSLKPKPITEYSFILAKTRNIHSLGNDNYEYIECGLSVRCVKNE